MIIKKKNNSHVGYGDITPKKDFINRRKLFALSSLFVSSEIMGLTSIKPSQAEVKNKNLNFEKGYSRLNEDDKVNSFNDITTYNNFYEFGTSKSNPSENSGNFKTIPWSVDVGGLCLNPGILDLDKIIKEEVLEERVYRLRCVEAWSMVIPWIGIPLSRLIKKFEPMSSAKFIRFETVYRPKEMPGQRSKRILPWPYVEALRIDEAMNDLTFIAVGLYGDILPNQNGAPLRLVIPWKYGFKSIKSIVKISFTKDQPINTWNRVAPKEYGFYANVNPNVDHPRWSQKRERRIGEFLRRPTLMFNGYTEEVGHMYANLDLKKNF